MRPGSRLLLRCWIEQQGYALPDTQKLHAIQSSVLKAGQDRYPCVTWQDCVLRRYRDDLHLLSTNQAPKEAGRGLKLDKSSRHYP